MSFKISKFRPRLVRKVFPSGKPQRKHFQRASIPESVRLPEDDRARGLGFKEVVRLPSKSANLQKGEATPEEIQQPDQSPQAIVEKYAYPTLERAGELNERIFARFEPLGLGRAGWTWRKVDGVDFESFACVKRFSFSDVAEKLQISVTGYWIHRVESITRGFAEGTATAEDLSNIRIDLAVPDVPRGRVFEDFLRYLRRKVGETVGELRRSRPGVPETVYYTPNQSVEYVDGAISLMRKIDRLFQNKNTQRALIEYLQGLGRLQRAEARVLSDIGFEDGIFA